MSNVASLMGMAAGFTEKVSLVGWVAGVTTTGSTMLVSLASVDVQVNDLILVLHQRASLGDKRGDMNLSTSGYTLLSSQYSNDSYDSNQELYYKFSDGTETSVLSQGQDSSAEAASLFVVVWRNVNSVNLIGSNLGVNISYPTFPAATGLIYGDVVVCAAMSSHLFGALTYSSYGSGDTVMTKIIDNPVNDTSADLTSAIAYKDSVVGSFAPSMWTMSASSSTNSNIGTTLVLSNR